MSIKKNNPLVVDLDGTLINSDLLLESFLAMIRLKFWLILLVPFWLLKGKAYFKQCIANHAEIDVTLLPWNEELLNYLRAQKVGGRQLILATASNEKFARAVAEYLGIFDGVIASDDKTNNAGSKKAAAINAHFGSNDYAYAGNARPDIKVWQHCTGAIIAGPAVESLRKQLPASCELEATFATKAASLKTWIKACRLHQWLKNMLVFAPFIAGHQLAADKLTLGVLAFFAFGLCASSVYLLNDLLDLDADRAHATKCKRPFASGQLPVMHGLLLAPVLLLISAVIASMLPLEFAATLVFYFAATTAYSFSLKRKLMLDVIILAGLYTLRIIGGAAAGDIQLSFWLLAFSMFVFLSLAIVKRYTELMALREKGGKGKAKGRGYHVDDIPMLSALGASSGYLSVLVLALYLNADGVKTMYQHPARLWLLCPVFLFWISRTWMIAHRGEMDDDPIVFAIKDRTSQVTVLIMAAVFVLASTGMV